MSLDMVTFTSLVVHVARINSVAPEVLDDCVDLQSAYRALHLAKLENACAREAARDVASLAVDDRGVPLLGEADKA